MKYICCILVLPVVKTIPDKLDSGTPRSSNAETMSFLTLSAVFLVVGSNSFVHRTLLTSFYSITNEAA